MAELRRWVLFAFLILSATACAQNISGAPSIRDQNWVEDLDTAESTLLRLDLSFTPTTKTRFSDSVSKIRHAVSSLTDDQIVVSLAKAVAEAENAHTRLYLLRNRTELRRLPIRIWWFGNDLHIVRSSKQFESIVGCRVLTIAGATPEKIFAQVAPMYTGTTGWKRYMSTYTMTSPAVLHGIGVLRDPGAVNMRVRCASGEKEVLIAPFPLARSSQPVESWQDIAPLHIDKETPASVAMPSTPLYLRNPDSNYWFQYVPEDLLVYFQFNRAADDPKMPIREFGQQLLNELRSRKPRTLVVDLRFNTGGNLDLARGLMESLQSVSSSTNVYVIESGTTFSAGIYHVAQWKQRGNKTVLVGEEPGDSLVFWAEGGNFKLPHSGLTVHYANGEHCYSVARAADRSCYANMPVETLSPDLPATLSYKAYAEGVDPSLALIIEREKKAALKTH